MVSFWCVKNQGAVMSLEVEKLSLLDGIAKRMTEYRQAIMLDAKKIKKEELQTQMNGERFWEDQEKSKLVVGQLKAIKAEVDAWESLDLEIKDCFEMIELSAGENDLSVEKEIDTEITRLKAKFDAYELTMLLSGPNDQGGCILDIHAGAGGTESCDWANMLLRMYLRYAERNGYKAEILDFSSGEEAGVKSVSVEIPGSYVYGYLKSEIGVHRLVRISPFDANKKRHTSFASIDITPIYEDIPNIEINPADLKIDTYRASGAGGQHVNTTDSAVRITHVPSGIITQCQNQRSQYKNKDKAMDVLKQKLYALEEEKRRKETQRSYEDKTDNGWGSQIRSYVLHPYQMIKDHRTSFEVGNIEPVLDGALDGFIEAYLRQKASQTK